MKPFLRWSLLLPVLLALAGEALPYGVVLIFAAGPTERLRQTFSYFDLTPVGYGNIGPFVTGILTFILVVLALLYALRPSKVRKKRLQVLSLAAFVTSLLPLCFGLDFFSFLGGGISCLLLLEGILVWRIPTD
mgnify:CR=1 FL=1